MIFLYQDMQICLIVSNGCIIFYCTLVFGSDNVQLTSVSAFQVHLFVKCLSMPLLLQRIKNTCSEILMNITSAHVTGIASTHTEGCTSVYSPQRLWLPISWHSCQRFTFFQCNKYEMLTHWWFALHFLNYEEGWASYHMCISHLNFFFCNLSAQILCPFFQLFTSFSLLCTSSLQVIHILL